MNSEHIKTFFIDTLRLRIHNYRFIGPGLLVALLAGCGGGGGQVVALASTPVSAPLAPVATLDLGVKKLQFRWPAVSGASAYKLLENPDGASGFSVIQDGLTTTGASKKINVLSHDWTNARYIVEACNSLGCTDSDEMNTLGATLKAIGYVKASNTDNYDWFGWSLALSGDGRTLAVSAKHENSNATGIDGNQADNTALQAGAVYLFRYGASGWIQQAYLKGSNTEAIDQFGTSVALSIDGNTLAVGAEAEDSNASGINPAGGQNDNSASIAGAAYVFRHTSGGWMQQAYIKASSSGVSDRFGAALALSSDGNTLVVGAYGEDSNATGINGLETDNSNSGSGAVYQFRYAGSSWLQTDYIKASNTGAGDNFGGSNIDVNTPLALSDDASVLAVGAHLEGSSATGISTGDAVVGADNAVSEAGAVYLC